jgi:hypothetical protein
MKVKKLKITRQKTNAAIQRQRKLTIYKQEGIHEKERIGPIN